MKNRFSKNTIGKAFEMIFGFGYTISFTAESLGTNRHTVSDWIKKHYPKIQKTETITLKSKV